MGNERLAPMPPAVRSMLDQRVLSAMQRIEYRRIVAPEDFEEVGRLRRDAFNARPLYTRKFTEPVIEDLDLADETYVFGLYDDGSLLATARLNLLVAGSVETPALVMCRNVLEPMLQQGMVFVDLSRFAIDPDLAHESPVLPMLTHRLSTMMTIHFNADHCVGAAKLKHEAYYRRTFRATRIAGPFIPDGMLPETVLLGVSRANQDYVIGRNPLFDFTETEARMLFENRADKMPPLNVIPTARFAQRAA